MQRKNICYTGENGGQKITRKTKVWLGVVIVLQTIVYLVAGTNKAYIHMDEAFSLGLAQYDKVNIQDEADFYNHWHTDEYYQDYLALQEDERGEFKAVYENQKNDVHPPLYYLLLRIVMGMSPGRFSKWPGIILNMVIQVGNTIVLFLIVRELLGKRMESREKLAVVMAGGAGLTMAAVSAVVYIRMYQLLTFWMLLTLWMNLRIRETGKLEAKNLAGLMLMVVLGCLTQYYYIFGLGMMWLAMAVWYAKEKKWRELAIYTGALIGAGGVVFLIWSHLIQHLFGYRGQGAVGNLLNLGQMGKQVWDYVLLMDYYDFHRGLLALLVVGIGLWVWRKARKKETKQQEEREAWGLVVVTSLGYFVIAAIMSPFIELRYVMPVMGLMFVMVIAGICRVSEGVWSEKTRERVTVGVMGVVLLLAPVQLITGQMRIELLYRDKEELMREVEEKAEVPAVYFITTENNRFLDNILLFATWKESYIALDLEPTEAEVKEIMAGKDFGKGLYVLVSGVMDQEKTLETVKEATGLKKVRYVRGVNTCEIYYLE